MRALVFPTAAAILLFSLTSVSTQGTDPVVGIWELNVARSHFSSGPPPKSETRTYAMAGQEIKATSKTVGADGKTTTGAWSVVYDGKDRPQSGSPDVDSLALTRIDPFHTAAVEKKGGKVVSLGTRVISPDGKTMTITDNGTNAKGQPVANVLVYDKR